MKISSYLKNVLSTGDGSDFSIFILDDEGKKAEKKVHKLVIKQCPYFAAMLDLNSKEAKEGCVTIDNIPSNIFDYVLQYLYSNELAHMKMEEAIQLAVAADYLQLEDLKTDSLSYWADEFMVIVEDKDAIAAFRTLVMSPLDIKPSDNSHYVMEKLLIASYRRQSEISMESVQFIQFFVRSFGTTHPHLTTQILAKWAQASEIESAAEQKNERKEVTEELLKYICLHSLTLQSLVVLSKNDVFPATYMIKQMQRRVAARDQPASDEVHYDVFMKTNRLIELEFEGDIALFYLKGLDDDDDDDAIIRGPEHARVIWEFIRAPDNCEFSVKLNHPRRSVSWEANAMEGPFTRVLNEFKLEDGNLAFLIKFKSKEKALDIKYEYEYSFDLPATNKVDK